MKRRAIVIVSIAAALVVVGIVFVIKLYVNQFGSKYSNDLNHWASFGDYIGGVVNTIVALASLFMIGFITIILGKDKDDYRFERRNDAYDHLLNYMPRVNLAPSLARQIIQNCTRQLATLNEEVSDFQQNVNNVDVTEIKSFENRRNQIINEFIKDYNEHTILFREYQLFLKNFYPRYGHVFKNYKFDGKHKSEYQKMVTSAKQVVDCLDEYKDVISQQKSKRLDEIQLEDSAKVHFDLLTEFINNLRKEL